MPWPGMEGPVRKAKTTDTSVREAPQRPTDGITVEELAPRLRKKVRVVVQSSSTALRQRPVQGTFRVCVIGHLRTEKDPLPKHENRSVGRGFFTALHPFGAYALT